MPETVDRCTTRESLAQYLNEIASDAAAGDITARETARLHRDAIKAHFAHVDRMAAVRDAQVAESREGKVKREPTATSARAARKVALKSGTQRARVLAYLVENNGATDHEIGRDLAMGSNSVRPRRIELVEWATSPTPAGRGSTAVRSGRCGRRRRRGARGPRGSSVVRRERGRAPGTPAPRAGAPSARVSRRAWSPWWTTWCGTSPSTGAAPRTRITCPCRPSRPRRNAAADLVSHERRLLRAGPRGDAYLPRVPGVRAGRRWVAGTRAAPGGGAASGPGCWQRTSAPTGGGAR